MTESRTLEQALDGLKFAMVGTSDGETWRSRPLHVAEQDHEILRFLVTATAEWVAALENRGSPTAVTFSDPHQNVYVALQGKARTRVDRTTVERLWNPGAAAFFDGPDDPNIRILEVTVDEGEYWDGPSGRIGQMLSIVKAAVGADAGAHGPVVT